MPCFTRVRWSLGAVLALCATAGSVRAEATDAITRRTDRESRAVLRMLIANEIKNLKPCDLSNEWLSDAPIGVEDAQKFLVPNLRAEVLAPDDDRSVADILDPDAAMQQALCDKEAYGNRQRQMLVDFGTSKIEGEAPLSGPGRMLTVQRIAFGRPVFDATFRTAAFVVLFKTLSWRRDPDGGTKLPAFYLPDGLQRQANLIISKVRYVYRKRGKAWVKIAEDELVRGG